MQFKPRSITATEATPASVASYRVDVVDQDNITVKSASFPADPSGVTILPLGNAGGPLDASNVGHSYRFVVTEVGPGGEEADPQTVKLADNTTLFNVTSIPDGAESLIINL